jgi:hypothetical protein
MTKILSIFAPRGFLEFVFYYLNDRRMHRSTPISVMVILVLSGCNSEDRNHSIFADDIKQIEKNMLIINDLLPLILPQKDSMKIQSYFYDIEDQDTILYINAEKIGSMSIQSNREKVQAIL